MKTITDFLPFVLIAAYLVLYNVRKEEKFSFGSIKKIITEIMFVSSLLLVTVLRPLLRNSVSVIITDSILVFSFIGVFIFYLGRGKGATVAVEPIKNVIVLFTRTILSLYVTLTIFRYQAMSIQILLSVGITMLIFILGRFMDIKGREFRHSSRMWKFSFTKTYKILLGVFILSIISTVTFLNIPSSIESELNLSNDLSLFDGYVDNRGLTTDIRVEEVSSVLYEGNIDYQNSYENDKYIYYLFPDFLTSYNKNSKVIITYSFEGYGHALSSEEYFKSNSLKFININGTLYVTTNHGLYSISPETGLVKYDDEIDYMGFVFIENDIKYLLLASVEESYVNYMIIDEEGKETDLTNRPLYSPDKENYLFVEDKTLLEYYGENNRPYFNGNILFPAKENFEQYDSVNQIVYTSEIYGYETATRSDNGYRLNSYGTMNEKNSIVIQKDFKASKDAYYVVNSYLYRVRDDKYITVYSKDLEVVGYFRVAEHKELFDIRTYRQANLVQDIKYIDGELYLYNIYGLAKNDEEVLYRNTYKIITTELDFKLPFYNDYSVSTVVIIIISLFVPISDYMSTKKTSIKKKDETKA